MKKKRMRWLVVLLLILCIGLFAVFFFCNDHSQQQFGEEETAGSVVASNTLQSEGEAPAIEDEKRELTVFISQGQENVHDVLIPES